MSLVSGVRPALLRLEAAWWMSRTFLSNLATWAAVIGWASADPGIDHWQRMLAMVVAMAALNGSLFIVNDILDREGDKHTAPYLPIPSGLLSVFQSWLAAGAGVLICAAGMTYASTSGTALAATAGLLVLSILLSMLYSKTKDHGIVGSIVVAFPQSMPAPIAWVLLGGLPLRDALPVAAYLLLASVSNNILAALRDFEKDPEAGFRTLAVRIGAPGAFKVAAWLAFAAIVPVVYLAVARPGWWALAFLAVGGGIHVWCYPRLLRNFAEPDRGRVQRLADQRLYKMGEYVKHAAVVAAFNPLAGLVSVAVLYTCLRVGYHVYNKRLVGGVIRRGVFGDAQPAPVAPAEPAPAGVNH